MKKASLCAAIGTGMFVILQLVSLLINLGRWGGNTVSVLINIMQPWYLIGWGLVFYFFFCLYRKQ